MKSLLRGLAICLIAFSFIHAQDDLKPVVKQIDGQTFFCFTRAQTDTLVLKLEMAKKNKEELKAAHDYVDQLELSIANRDKYIEEAKKLNNQYVDQVENYKNLLAAKNQWWDSKSIWVGIGAVGMYLAVRAAAGIK